jgi:PAS domain-containing protein
MTVARLRAIAVLAIPILAAGEFLVDLNTPLGITDWVWYVIPLLFTLYVGGRSLPYVLAAVLSILLLLGFFFSPPGIDPGWALISRLVGVLVLWVMALMIWHRKHAKEALVTEQRLLNSLITATPDQIYFRDRESRFIRINEAFARRHGFPVFLDEVHQPVHGLGLGDVVFCPVVQSHDFLFWRRAVFVFDFVFLP